MDKAFAKVGGVSLVERVSSVLKPLFEEIMIIGNRREGIADLGYPVYEDIYPATGALGGIYTGLIRARNFRTFFAACDMPFLDSELIKLLVNRCDDADVVIPISDKGPEPLHAIYSKRCITHIENLIIRKDYKILSFFDRVRVKEIRLAGLNNIKDPALSLMNINTPEDLAEAERLAGVEVNR